MCLLSRLAREVLASSTFDSAGDELPARLIYPPDLTMNAEIAKLLKVLMPEAGRAAWKIARDTIAGLDAYEKDLAREIVDSLIVENVCGETGSLPIEQLKSLLPIFASSANGNTQTTPAVRDLLHRLETSTGGVIRLETDAARFDPAAAGAPELAAFNSALVLARGFDPRLTIARDRESLDARLNRLDASMALAVEGAVRTREVLTVALREANLEMPAANSTAIAEYIALAESGAAAMLEAAADRSYLDRQSRSPAHTSCWRRRPNRSRGCAGCASTWPRLDCAPRPTNPASAKVSGNNRRSFRWRPNANCCGLSLARES